MSKIAVVLFNLGGPDSREAIKPFLYNFFTDPNIIQLPKPLRFFIAGRIANKRSKKEADSSYKELGYCSPLLANTQAQANALETELNENAEDEYKTFVCMRYWNPMSDAVASHVQSWAPDKIILLPLYPQFSTTTTGSSLEAWNKAAQNIGLTAQTATICCYPMQEGFIESSAQNIKAVYEKTRKESGKAPRLLLSAHGLPEKIIKGGDPYQWQCEESAAAIVERLRAILSDSKGSPSKEILDWQICYQSRVGRLKWIGPSTLCALEKAAEDKVPVIIYPHAFVSEHVETLVEIEMEYRARAENLGISCFARVPTVGTHDAFIKGLASMVRGGAQGISSNKGVRLCPQECSRCVCHTAQTQILEKAA